MERQARLLGKTYKQNLTILIDTEQTKMNLYFIDKKKQIKKNSIFNESIQGGVKAKKKKKNYQPFLQADSII